MIKINISKLTFQDFEVLRPHYEAEGYEVLTFENYKDFERFCEVIGYYNALEIVRAYGIADAQAIANLYFIEEPFKNIEALASCIIQEVLEKYIEV